MQPLATEIVEAPAGQGTVTYSRSCPFAATVTVNRLLTGPASEKETRHVEMSLAGSGIQYLPGDSVGVLPENRCDLVEEVLWFLHCRGDEPVTDFYGGALDLRAALTSWLMIGKLSGSTVRNWAKLTGNVELTDLVLPKNKKKLDDYLWGREFRDLLEQYPMTLENPQQLFKNLPRLAPRLYSISSSQALHPATVHLSVRVVRYESYHRDRLGVCSGQIGERTPTGASLPSFIHSNQMDRVSPLDGKSTSGTPTVASGAYWMHQWHRCRPDG